VGPEAKLYKKLVKEWREFTFTRLENISLLGTPDLLVYNNKAQTLGPRATNRFQMFRGSRIMELAACGLKLDACCLGLDACYNFLSELGA
jgi:hypothetical protein